MRKADRRVDLSEVTGPRAWQIPLALALLLATVSVFVPVSVAQWLVAAGGASSVAALAKASVHPGARRTARGFLARHPLALISAGLWLNVLGEVLHATGAEYPSYADAIALAGYPFVVVGLLRIVRTRLSERPLDTLLVAAIVPAAAGAFGWMPMVASMSERISGHGLVTGALLLVDTLAVAMLARLTVLFRARPVADRLLLLTFCALLGAHVSRAAADVTGVVPAPFGSQTLMLVAFGLLAAAAMHPSLLPSATTPAQPHVPQNVGRMHVTLLGLAVVLGPVAVLMRATNAGEWFLFAVGGTALVSLLVVAHLGRLVRERGELEHESAHDPLTGLPNRTRFHDLIDRAGKSGTAETPFAIGFVDLDRFKKVNDSLGHNAGDGLLRQIADRLRAHVRDGDVVARLAGDEFGLLLPGIATPGEATEIAQRVLDAFGDGFTVNGQSLFMTPSIGVAMYPAHGRDPETLLKHADAAMYEAKRLGRNTVEMFTESLGAQAHQQLATETRLQIGIGNGELVVYYQPKVSLRTGTVTGVEALVRWDHPTIGLVPPGAFMRLAEETGLVASIGEHVLRAACAQLAEWRRFFPDLTVSVNLSLRQFNLQDVVAVVRRALDDAGLPANALELELTESSDLNDAGGVVATLTALRDLGVCSSIDDFGTGYSGIAYLNDLPIDKIKLDKSFIDTIGRDRDAPLVRAMIAMAHSLDLEVVAEGVETKEQLAFLREQGCDTIQGYLFSRPLPAERMGTLLAGDRSAISLFVPHAVSTERQLGELILAEAQVEAAALVADLVAALPEQRGHETLARRTLVVSSVAGVMTVPTLLGLTAAAALPGAAQEIVSEAFGRIGATQPRATRAPGRSAPVPAQPGSAHDSSGTNDAAPTGEAAPTQARPRKGSPAVPTAGISGGPTATTDEPAASDEHGKPATPTTPPGHSGADPRQTPGPARGKPSATPSHGAQSPGAKPSANPSAKQSGKPATPPPPAGGRPSSAR